MAGKIITEMRKHYVLRSNDLLLTRILASPSTTPRVALLSGPPGTGKTFYAECLAKAMDAKFIMFQLHAWVSSEELVRTPNVAAIAANANNEPSWLKGVLWNAVESSHQGKVVLCLDEIDKAYERTEYALLEFLNTAQFTLPSGETMRANARNLVVIITTNETRELHEATLRRCYRHRMTFLPEQSETKLVARLSGTSENVCGVVVRRVNELRSRGISSTSTREIAQFCEELKWCTCANDVYSLAYGRVFRGNVSNTDANVLVQMVLEEMRKNKQEKGGAK